MKLVFMQKLKFIMFVFMMMFMGIARMSGQEVVVSGVLVCNGEGLPGMAVQLLNNTDSSFVCGGVSDEKGEFQLKTMQGRYLLWASMMGYKSYYQSLDVTQSMLLDTLIIEEERLKINEVTIVGIKSSIEYSAGKITIDPSASIVTSQGNMFDALKNVPGVIVSEDGTIMLNGQTGVKVQVNGKDSYLSGVALANLLKSTAASSVDKIDVISNPTAEYDASGKAGIINIRLRKKQDMGITFATNIDYKQWDHARGNIWAQTTYRKKNVGIGVNYYHFLGKDGQNGVLYREYGTTIDPKIFSKSMRQHVYLNNYDRIDDITLFGDIDLSKRISLNSYINGNFFHRNVPGGSQTTFSNNGTAQDTVLNTRTCSDLSQIKYNGGVHGKYQNENDMNIDLSIDYLDYSHKENSQMYSTMNYLNILSPIDSMLGDMGGTIRIFSMQGNFSMPLNKEMNLKAGAKSISTDIDNHAIYRYPTSNGWIMNANNSSKYAYYEQINAAYAQVESRIGKWGALLGLRLEATQIDGTYYALKASTTDSSYHRRDCKLFPTAGVLYTIDDNKNLSMIYNRRITRPNYKDLSPFNYMADEYTRTAGNPKLKAEITHNLEVAYVFQKTYRVSLFGIYTSDIIVQSVEKEGNGGFLAYPQNLAANKRAGIKLDAGRLIDLKWWQMSTSVILFAMENRWKELGVQHSKSSIIPMFNFNSQFLLPKNWSLQLTGNYNGKIQFGQISVPIAWKMDGGIRKKWNNGKMSLSLYMNDLFFSIKEKSQFKIWNMEGYTKMRREDTSIGISFYYSFSQGIVKDKQNEIRKMEESDRINF